MASAASGPRLGTAHSTAIAGVPASLAMSRDTVTARRSTIDGRHGMSTRSAARAAVRAGASAYGGRVDEAELCVVLAGPLEDVAEARGRCRHDDRGRGGARVAPGRSRGLGIEVDDECGSVIALGRDREVDRERRFPGAALLRDHRHGQHGRRRRLWFSRRRGGPSPRPSLSDPPSSVEVGVVGIKFS